MKICLGYSPASHVDQAHTPEEFSGLSRRRQSVVSVAAALSSATERNQCNENVSGLLSGGAQMVLLAGSWKIGRQASPPIR